MSVKALLFAGLTALAAATPTKTIDKRADVCGQWDSITTGSYILYNNLWGISGSSGSQCVGVDSLSGTTIKWHSTYDISSLHS